MGLFVLLAFIGPSSTSYNKVSLVSRARAVTSFMSCTFSVSYGPILSFLLFQFRSPSFSFKTGSTALTSSSYGFNLERDLVLQKVGFEESSGKPRELLFAVSTGKLIITVLGFVLGTMPLSSLFRSSSAMDSNYRLYIDEPVLVILAVVFHELSTEEVVVCYSNLFVS